MNALTVAEVSQRVSLTARTIRELARDGRFPMPIDPTLGPRQWRWSPQSIDRYVAGEWRPEPAEVPA